MRLHGVKLIAFDADGTLRRCTVAGQHFPCAAGEWEILPGVREKLASIDWGTVGFGVASNQGGVAAGMLSEPVARSLLIDMARDALSLVPGMQTCFRPPLPMGFIQLCPHGSGEVCACRKPMPGMLRRIMAFYDVRSTETLFVGNADTDMQAAANAGCRFSWAREFFS